MLTKDEIERYKEAQKKGMPISPNLISIPDAVKVVGRSFMNITKAKAENPGIKVKGRITWWIVGSIIMLDQASLIKIAIARKWIEEV